MGSVSISSRTFASLVNELQNSPADPNLKQKVVKHIPQMKELAKTDALALYHLAFIYPPKSPQRKDAVLRSANLGCTNAMYTACLLSIENNDKEKATYYRQKIEESQDTYIIEESKMLFDNYFQQTKEVKSSQTSINPKNRTPGFFTTKPKREEDDIDSRMQKTYN
ncbi:hypothetical protein [Legionella sp.]|uniref:hypothetical protein n=1 Tax=Legionella sp. TaxID=459 RepID=UPI003CA1FF5A